MKFWVVEMTNLAVEHMSIYRGFRPGDPAYIRNAPGFGFTHDRDKARKYNTHETALKAAGAAKRFWGGTVKTVQYTAMPTNVTTEV